MTARSVARDGPGRVAEASWRKAVLHRGTGAEVRGAAFALAHVLVGVRMKNAGKHLVDVSVKIVTSHSKHP